MRILTGRVIKHGRASGVALVSPEPIGFFGLVDAETGVVLEPGHPLVGQSVSGRVLVFPTGKGSTVGSYSLYRLARAGRAPVATGHGPPRQGGSPMPFPPPAQRDARRDGRELHARGSRSPRVRSESFSVKQKRAQP